MPPVRRSDKGLSDRIRAVNLARSVLCAGVVLSAAAFLTRPVQSAGMGPAPAAQATPAPDAVDLNAARAIVKRYCVSCHNERLKTGGLVLSTLDPAEVGRRPRLGEGCPQTAGRDDAALRSAAA